MSSHDVVRLVRRRYEDRPRVGHAGTLDPFATGLLIVLVGQATRAQRFLISLPKTYRTVARLGWRSETGDPEGPLEETGRVPERLEIPTGQMMQRPPAYSAVRVRGDRLYRWARRGDPQEPEPRPITVHRAELIRHDGARVEFEIECSAGTYIRQLVADLGDAYCEELERTAIGPFRLEDADPERLLSLTDALAFMPARDLSDEEAAAVGHGRRLTGPGKGPVRLMHAGEVVAIGEPRGAELQPVVVFRPR